MKVKYICWFFLSFLLFTQHAYSSSIAGKVDTYWVSGDGYFFVFAMSGTIASKPACNTSSRYAVSIQTEPGKAIKEAIISAKSSGLAVVIGGSGRCTYWGDSEDVRSMAVGGNPVIPVSVVSSSANLTGFWATAMTGFNYSGPPCNYVCSLGNVPASAAADSNGYVCKNSQGIPGKSVNLQNLPGKGICGGIGDLAQCYCVTK